MDMSGTPISELENYQQTQQYPDINTLTQDINNSLVPTNYDEELDYDDVPDLEFEKEHTSILDKFKKYKYILYQAIALLIIYIIMSQQAVIKSTSKIFPQILQDSTGNVSLMGQLIYGIIIVIIFIVISILIEKFL